MTNQRREHSDLTEQEQAWIDSFPEKGAARCCVRYARAFNRLDLSCLEEWLSSNVTYGSQSVFDRMTSRSQVLPYLQKKIAAIRQSDCKVVAELASYGDRPVVAMFQSHGTLDTNWLDAPIAVMQIDADEDGKVAAMLMITCVPDPASAQRHGIYPGLQEIPAVPSRRFVRRASDYSELVLVAFYLNEQISLDRDMKESIAAARASLPGIQVVEMNWQKQGGSRAWETYEQFGFVGFPSVGVTCDMRVIYRHQGMIGPNELIEAIKRASPIYVVEKS